MGENDDYEVIPLSPIRKMEDRLDRLETTKEATNLSSFLQQVVDLVKANQRMVEQVLASNADLVKQLEKIPAKIDEVMETWKELLELLKVTEGGQPTDMSEKMDKLIDLNTQIVESNKKLAEVMQKRPAVTGTLRTPGPTQAPPSFPPATAPSLIRPLGAETRPPSSIRYPRIRIRR